MTLRRYKDILAIRDGEKVLGFHARNLQLAELDESAWNALSPRTHSTQAPEALQEIQTWEQEIDSSVREDRLTQSVRSFVINITQYCNLRCTYCAAGGDGTYGSNSGAKAKVDLTLAQAQLKKFIDATPDGETFCVQFFGGEPLLHPDAIESLAHYSKLLVAGRDVKVTFSITTNGTMITQDIAEMLARLNCSITLSLDGPAEINDRVRPNAGGKGSTEKVLKGLSHLIPVRSRLSGLGVNAVMGEHNMELITAYKFFQGFDFDFINFIYAVGESDDRLSRKWIGEMEEVLALADRHGGEKELRKFPIVDHDFDSMDRRARTVNHCGAGKSLLYSDTKGALYTCNWFMDDLKEKVGQGTELFKDKMIEYKENLIDKHDCRSCFARFLCGGGCMFVNKVKMGDKHVSDPHYCMRTRALTLTHLKYFAKHRQENQI